MKPITTKIGDTTSLGTISPYRNAISNRILPINMVIFHHVSLENGEIVPKETHEKSPSLPISPWLQQTEQP